MTPAAGFWLSQIRADLDPATFDCGVDSLDRWLAQMALRTNSQDIARVYVWTRPDSARVVAYFAVSPTLVARQTVGRSLGGGQTEVPGFLLGRLALDRSLHGRGLGGQLLLDALETIVLAARSSGGRVIVVDPVGNAAAEFYAHHGFIPTVAGPRMAMKVATAAGALGGRLGA
ncbi:MAG: hypothetical protein LBG60_05370 [Bifidobacteriaceae bacterium]|jgi:predicted N-acetyltransferase YhbS|nr:hypothetical protein [Bifidobacteriaceae bacterium]